MSHPGFGVAHVFFGYLNQAKFSVHLNISIPCMYKLLFLPILLAAFCNRTKPAIQASVLPTSGEKMMGLTFVAPPEPFSNNPMPAVKSMGAGWIAVVPYAFTRPGNPHVQYNEGGWQWWGERPEGVAESIRLAHENGLRVMLKPQVYVPGSWTGMLRFDTPEAWASWELDYSNYILNMAKLGAEQGAELFCIGTEFRTAIAERPAYWSELIKQVRAVFPGKLVYSANWDDWEQAPFWTELDYIGLSSYFPLVEGATPDVEAMKTAWEPIRNKLKAFSQKKDKPVLFTEYGYLSVDGCGWRNWELEKNIEQRAINEQAQANAYEALFQTFHAESWWAGGFLWKWFPNMRGHEGYPERDYTPQGKKGEEIIRKWYVVNRQSISL